MKPPTLSGGHPATWKKDYISQPLLKSGTVIWLTSANEILAKLLSLKVSWCVLLLSHASFHPAAGTPDAMTGNLAAILYHEEGDLTLRWWSSDVRSLRPWGLCEWSLGSKSGLPSSLLYIPGGGKEQNKILFCFSHFYLGSLLIFNWTKAAFLIAIH